MKEIPKELKIVLTKDKFKVDKEITLTRKDYYKSYIHKGRGELDYIKWCEYRLPSDIGKYIEELRPYDNIALSFFRITPEYKESAEKNLIETGVTKSNCPVPHIHLTSGNIHPSREYVQGYVKQYDEDTISQLVLCNGLGPKISTSHGVCADELDQKYNLYPNLYPNHSKKLYVHKASYYPLISEEKGLKEDIRYVFLSLVWEKLKEESIVINP